MDIGTAARCDAIIVGSGFGAAMAGHALVQSGFRPVMIERGGWVPRGPESWSDHGTLELTPFYSTDTPYRRAAPARARALDKPIGSVACVGGPSVFYGGVSLRMRESDFAPAPGGGACWPLEYAEIEPYYARAERLLAVAGEVGRDPTEPWRSAPYPVKPAPLTPAAKRLWTAAESLGLRPFRLPVAIRYHHDGRPPCTGCSTCDTFACAHEAKNDLASTVLPRLIRDGLTLLDQTVVTGIETERHRVSGVRAYDKRTGRSLAIEAPVVVLAAGALGSAHLVLSSGLERLSPAGEHVGHHLMRHCCGLVYGLAGCVATTVRLHKQVAVHDHYVGARGEPLGSIQQMAPPPVGLMKREAPALPREVARALSDRALGLITIAEDRAQHRNHVSVDRAVVDRFGLPQLVLHHEYAEEDLAARQTMMAHARQILERARARLLYPYEIETFSHALGTLRMGRDAESCPVDADGRFRGVEGLWVVDASTIPRSAGVNPSLTISALALRAGERIAAALREAA